MNTSNTDFVYDILRFARTTPDAPAVLDAGRVWRYTELVRRADEIATALGNAGVSAGEVVAVPAHRGGETVAALLGILLRGAAYLAFDPADPPARTSAMLTAARTRLVLADVTGVGSSDLLPQKGDTRSWGGAEAPPAYLIFTSGSTGVPKGVVVSREALSWHARTTSAAYGLTVGDVVLQGASLVFDVAAEEIWPTLASGATLSVPATPVSATSYAQLTAHLNHHSVTVCNLPSSLFAGWAATIERGGLPPAIRLVVVGSEPLAASAVARWRRVAPGVALVNAYGLSEATITSLIHTIDDSTGTQVPIGSPLPGMTARIVDPAWQPVVPGTRGELVLAGPGLALGYTDPSHEAQRFAVTDLGDGERRWLRTGDLAREVDGRIVLDGRVDDQVKIAGRRIEPQEICQALLDQPEVNDARVVVIDDRLIACVVGRGKEPALLDALRAVLPAYLVPATVLWYDAFPVTAGGKVDRRALEVDVANRLQPSPHPAVDPDVVRALWRELLPGPVEDEDADFFALGGNSLQAALLLLRLRRDLGVALNITDLFAAPRLGEFQRLVAARQAQHQPA